VSIFKIAQRVLVVSWALTFMFLATPSSSVSKTADQLSARVSIRAQNEPVRSVLMRLAHDSGVNVAVAEGVSGYVTVALHNVTVAEALDAILTPLGDVYHARGSVYVVEHGSAAATIGQSTSGPTVLPLTVIPSKRAAAILRPLFPQASIREDANANALVVIAPPSDVQAMRSVLQGTDVRNPTLPTTEAIPLRTVRAGVLIGQLHGAFPAAKFAVAGERQLLVTAIPADMAQIKATVNGLDTPMMTPPPVAASSEAVHVTQRAPREVARALAAQVPGLHAAVSGSAVVLSGTPDVVSRGKMLVAQLDVPNFGDRFTQVYRIRSLDAGSVADLLRRSFHDLEVTVDVAINALAVTGTAAQQQRIADAIAQLDPPPGSQGAAGVPAAGNGSTEVVNLKSFMPGQTQGGVDAVAAMTQAIQVVAADVRVVQLPTPGQIALLGPPASVRAAREFIEKVDAVPPLVVLDTEILEVDETVAKNLGLQLGTAAISTTFTEMQPPPNANGTTPQLGRFQAFSRTPISFTAQLNLLIQNGKGRVLADPRITTLSGRTASIRAGDTISILTTTSGNAGTIATTQVQSFQTGVTLDITPVVAPDGGVTVWLHPVVNSLIGTNAGVPEISTRDTQTTVHLQNDETLVIGGLIQENETRTTTKLPLLGDLPLVGKLFRNDNVQGQRNELIIVVTPHVVKPGTPMPGPPLRAIPSAQPLPTLPPNTQLPNPVGQLPRPGTGVRTPSRAGAPVSVGPPLIMPSGSPTPAPAPSAFAQTNVFTFGAAPQSNFARPTDPVQIFYATLSPTVVTNGAQVHVAAVTTSNASSVRLTAGSTSISLAMTAPGQWQGTFPFPAAAVAPGQTNIPLQLVASRSDGSSATIPIAVNLAP
jgi:type II secretory pathway component GspD/PulD (secretin)